MIEKLPDKDEFSLLNEDEISAIWGKIQELIDKVNALEKPCTCPTEDDLGWEAVDKKYVSSWDE